MSETTSDIRPRLTRLKELKIRRDEAVKAAKHAENEYKRYESALYADMRASDQLSVKTSEGLFTCKSTTFATVQDREAFEAWVRSKGLEDEFLRTEEQKGRLNELVRDMLNTGQDLPPGVGWYPREVISLTK